MVKSLSALLATSLSLLLALSVESRPAPTGQTVALNSSASFCLLLPKDRGGNIADSENSAIAFCSTKDLESSLKAKALPSGFIKSAHIKIEKNEGWIQVTGKIDRSKYGLDPKDGGGQYDIKAPKGSFCDGYDEFVQIIEPNDERYCLRCCNNPTYCPRSKSTDGCEVVVPGTYT